MGYVVALVAMYIAGGLSGMLLMGLVLSAKRKGKKRL